MQLNKTPTFDSDVDGDERSLIENATTGSGTDVVFDFGNNDMLTVLNATIGQLENDLMIV